MEDLVLNMKFVLNFFLRFRDLIEEVMERLLEL